MMLVLVVIEELADSRDGVLTLDEATRGGLTLRQVRHRVRTGQWTKLHPGVYLVGRRVPDQQASARAAVAWAGPGAVASGLTAAWWWQLRDWAPGAAEVTVPRTRSRRCPPAVVLRRRNLDPVDLVVLRGLPVTALPLTVLDAAAALGNDSGRPLVDRSGSTSLSRSAGWPSRLMAGRGIPTSDGSRMTGAGKTPWCWQGGPCCASPGTT